MVDLNIFSKRLKEAREAKGLNQKVLAERVGVTPASLSAYEKDGKNPSLNVAAELARECGVSLDWLCGLSDIQGISGSLESYKDIISLLFRIEDSCPQKLKITRTKINEGEKVQEIIYFADILMYEFFKEWGKMKAVFDAGMIDKEVYGLWREKSLRKYSLSIGDYWKHIGNGAMDNPFDFDSIGLIDEDGNIIEEIPWDFIQD